MRDFTGDEVEVLCVKGSGWDMADIEPAGLPAVRLAPLRDLLALERLSDEDMVNFQRRNLLDASAPNPSVETLLHAFLPHKFIDHTHSNAVLALTDQPDGADLCREVYGERVALVPYVMPGFALAKSCAAVHAAHPEAETLILLKHGIFTMGASAREAYERMIEMASLAEARLATGPQDAGPGQAAARACRAGGDRADPARIACDRKRPSRGPLEALRARVPRRACRVRLRRWRRARALQPGRHDHARSRDPHQALAGHRAGADGGRARRFRRWRRPRRSTRSRRATAPISSATPRATARDKKPLDPAPRVVLVPGMGLFAAGDSAKAARVAADIAEAAAGVILDAEAIGRFESIAEADLFDIEYWSLEQAKLGKGAEKPLARHIVAITGGAGAIGSATGAAFKAEGAEVALLDRDTAALDAAARKTGALAVACDVTDDASVKAAFATVAERFGGLDILVSNAGAAWQGRIGEVDDKILRDELRAQFLRPSARGASGGRDHAEAEDRRRAPVQRLEAGGQSRSRFRALRPAQGRDLGARPPIRRRLRPRRHHVQRGQCRSHPKRPLDRRHGAHARQGARRERGRLYGGNLLGREVKAEDVAKAFVDLALSRKTTGAVLTVDGGNIAAALR